MLIFPDYDSPSALKAFLESRGMGMQKKFGQNFLINAGARKKLLDSLNIKAGDEIWEVGPGLGVMTRDLLERGGRVTAFEIDRGFCAVLRDFFSGNPDFILVEGDVMKTWKETGKDFLSCSVGKPFFFGNLPYNIAASLMADFITSMFLFDRALVTVQKEVALRMGAGPGSGDYSSFSVLCTRFYDVKCVMDLAPGNFWPRPNVVSRAVLLEKKAVPAVCSDDSLFFALVRALFVSRRKTIKNNLSAWLSTKTKNEVTACETASFMLQYAGIAHNERAENLSPEVFCSLADAAKEAGLG